MTDLVIGIGEILWDILPEGKKPGGAPANFAYHISRFGLPGLLVSAVGDDCLGNELIQALTAKGLRHHIAKVPYPTGSVQVEIDQDGIPRYDIKTNVAWDNIPLTPRLVDMARHTRAICFGTLAQRDETSRCTIDAFLDAMPRNTGSLVVFDANLRQDHYNEKILRDSIRRCNILKINDQELATISRIFGYTAITPEERCQSLLSEYDLETLILTCGTDGSYILTPHDISYLPTPQTDVADTVGAGDSFTAAFTASILKGKNIHEAHNLAVRTAAFVCTQQGAMPHLPTELTDI